MKLERERQISYDIIYMWNLKYDTNELNLNELLYVRRREQTCSCQGDWLEGWIGSLGLVDAD